MEIPIQVAVRIFSGYPNTPAAPYSIQTIPTESMFIPISNECGDEGGADRSGGGGCGVGGDDDSSKHLQPPPAYTTAGTIKIRGHNQTYPFAHSLPIDCSQDQIYHQTVYPMIAMFLEGFDASFVMYGQRGMGKTYTMLGPGFDCEFSESEQGIIQRCVRDIFNQLAQRRERNYVINIGWICVKDDEIHDLLDNSGNVSCTSIGDVFHWIQVGMNNKRMAQRNIHSIFTLTLEQQWISPAEGLIQHRLSTASFCDLCSTEQSCESDEICDGSGGGGDDRNVSKHLPADFGLQTLERIVTELATNQNCVQYTESTLTTLLKDSFGGRAQTLLILCISPLEKDKIQTIHNLEFAYKAQCIRNFVVLNTYSDNNTPITMPENGILNEQGFRLLLHQQQLLQHNHQQHHLGLPSSLLHAPPPPTTDDNNIGLQFAASQWLKLVSNAEGLFSRLIENKTINDNDRQRIEEWMFLKQECEECLSSGEINTVPGGDNRQLGPILEETDERDDDDDDEDENSIGEREVEVKAEAEENDDDDDDDDDEEEEEEETTTASYQQNTNTDNESDTESNHLDDLEDKIASLMENFHIKTDLRIKNEYQNFIGTHPKAVLDSNDCLTTSTPSPTAPPPPESIKIQSPVPPPPPSSSPPPPPLSTSTVADRRPSSPRGRRKSIQPGSVGLSSIEIARLNIVASQGGTDHNPNETLAVNNEQSSLLDSSSDDYLLRSMRKDPLEQIDLELRKIFAELEASELHIRELEGTITTTQELIVTLTKRNDAQQKSGFNKKKAKLEAEYQKYKKQFNKYASGSNGSDRSEFERLRTIMTAKKQVLKDFLSLNNHAENVQKIKFHQKTMKVAKKELDELYKKIKKNKKLQTEFLNDKQKLIQKLPASINRHHHHHKSSGGGGGNNSSTPLISKKNICDVTARISHLDHVIKEKSLTLKKFEVGGGCGGGGGGSIGQNVGVGSFNEECDSYRHEIRQLRRTRDQLVDQRCLIDRKLKKEKRISYDEQRKLFEYDEGIEAIDAAIEFKNEMICGGHTSVDTTESLQREKGSRMMMARLNNLCENEMRVMLYKYFQKAIDFRDSSLQMEKDRDFWETRARHLEHEVQRIRFESDRRAVLLHQEQEKKLALYLRHINDTGFDTSSSTGGGGGGGSATSGSYIQSSTPSHQTTPSNTNDRMMLVNHPHHYLQHHHSSSDIDLDTINNKQLIRTGGRHLDMLPQQQQQQPDGSLYYKYKPLDKLKEKEKNSSSKFFSKFTFKTQYRGGGNGNNNEVANNRHPSSTTMLSKRKVHDASMTIPEHNLKQLQGTTPTMPVTKVTKEKNKIIIQQDTKNFR